MNTAKMMRRAQIAKLTNEIINSNEYRERRKEDDQQNLMKALASFSLIAADYLYRQFNCKEAGVKKFINFIKKSMEYVKEDPEYFELLNRAFIDEIGVDVMKELGMEFEK